MQKYPNLIKEKKQLVKFAKNNVRVESGSHASGKIFRNAESMNTK
jgi:hypothetical protein